MGTGGGEPSPAAAPGPSPAGGTQSHLRGPGGARPPWTRPTCLSVCHWVPAGVPVGQPRCVERDRSGFRGAEVDGPGRGHTGLVRCGGPAPRPQRGQDWTFSVRRPCRLQPVRGVGAARAPGCVPGSEGCAPALRCPQPCVRSPQGRRCRSPSSQCGGDRGFWPRPRPLGDTMPARAGRAGGGAAGAGAPGEYGAGGRTAAPRVNRGRPRCGARSPHPPSPWPLGEGGRRPAAAGSRGWLRKQTRRGPFQTALIVQPP